MDRHSHRHHHGSHLFSSVDPLRARVLSIVAFVLLVGLWMMALWPFTDGVGLGLGLLFAGPIGLSLAILTAVLSLLGASRSFLRGRLRRFVPLLAGLCLTLFSAQMIGWVFCEAVVGLTCVKGETGGFGYTVASLMMLVGGGLVFSGVLAPVDTSSCDCAMFDQ